MFNFVSPSELIEKHAIVCVCV